MTESRGNPDDIPEALAEPAPRRSLQLVWIIPVVAALIGVWLALQAVLARGPSITIRFKTGEGLDAGKTKVKYKNVDIGEVKNVAFSQDGSTVLVTAQLAKQAERFLVEDTRFWVVRPRIGASGISGLGTLLSGSFIGVDVGKSTEARREFVGLETPPVVTLDRPGRQFVLRGEDLGSLDIASPVFFRRVQVGQVLAYELDKDGKGVTLKIFVNAPYDQFVTTQTRFWHASGFDLTLDATGVKVETESLTSIVLGGIAFQAPPDAAPGRPADVSQVFTLAADRAQAMRHPDATADTYVMIFRESVRGLSPGAPVDFRGVVVGEVAAIGVDFDTVRKEFTMAVEVRLYPERLRARYRPSVASEVPEPRALLTQLIERGFRGQLRTGNLLTGQLYIALDFFRNAPAATVDWSKDPPELPTMPGSLEELQVILASLAKKLEKIPFEAIAADVRKAMQTMERALEDTDRLVRRLDTELAPQARAALEDARKALAGAERSLAADAPLQQDLRETLRELGRAAQSLRVLADYLERHPESLIRGRKAEEP